MDLMRKTSLVLFTTSLLAACGGQDQTSPPVWEQIELPETVTEHTSVTHGDMTTDAFGDIVTLGTATSDADPSTPALDLLRELYLMKQDSNGNLIWKTLINYPADSGTPYEVESDNNGNLYAAGEGFILKTDRYGQVQWQDTFEGLVLSITVTDDRVYVPGKITRVYDLNGNLQLTIDNNDDYPWEIRLADNGDIIQATWTAITRHDSYGNLIWSAPAPVDVTTVARIQLDSAENVYVSYLSNAGDSGASTAAARVIRVNNNGSVAWNRFIPDRRPSSNYFKSGNVALHLTSNGELLNVTAGTKGRQLTRINPANGNVIWEKVHSGHGRADDSYLDSADNLYIAGGSHPSKYDASGNLVGTGDMRSTNTRNSLTIAGNRMVVGGIVYEDSQFRFYTVAFDK